MLVGRAAAGHLSFGRNGHKAKRLKIWLGTFCPSAFSPFREEWGAVFAVFSVS